MRKNWQPYDAPKLAKVYMTRFIHNSKWTKKVLRKRFF